MDLANWVFQALRQPDLVRVHEDPMHRVAIVAFNRVSSRLVLYWGVASQAVDGQQPRCAEDKAQEPQCQAA